MFVGLLCLKDYTLTIPPTNTIINTQHGLSMACMTR